MTAFRRDDKWLREYAARQEKAMQEMRSDAEIAESVRAAALAPVSYEEAWYAARDRGEPVFDPLNEYEQECQAANARSRVSLVLPWGPNVNHFWKPNGRGGKLLTDKTKAYRAAVLAVVLAQPLKAPFFPMIGRLRVTIHASPPDKRKRDLDGLLKNILDALQHAGVYADDEAIDDLRILRVAGEPGTVVVQIEVM